MKQRYYLSPRARALHEHETGQCRYQDDCTPVLVIDPEDAGQVSSLTKALIRLEQMTRSDTENVQAALRSLLPTPKPDEPQGLGAVVEDASGDQWVRTHHDLEAHWRSATFGGTYNHYADIAAVKVLSPGWSAES